MDDLPQPDVRDSRGRLRRLVLAALLGSSGGALCYFLANTLIAPEPPGVYVSRRTMSRDTFVIWVGVVSAIVIFSAAVAVQNWLARRRWRAERVPPARVV